MRSLDLTAKIRKNRSPASTPSPIPPSVVTCLGTRTWARSLEAPEITPPSPPFPSSKEQAEPASNATDKATSIRLFLMQGPHPTLQAEVPANARPPTKPPPP